MKKVNNPDRSNPVSPEELTAQYAKVFDSLPGNALAGEKAPHHVFGQLVRSPDVAEVFIPYWVATKTRLNFTVREQELIILRTACIYGCDYVWGHHVPVALEAGMTEEEILQVPLTIDEMTLPEKEKVLLLATDDITAQANVSEKTWEQLNAHYSEAQILDIITIVSQYVLFNSVNNIFGIRLENDSMPSLGKVK